LKKNGSSQREDYASDLIRGLVYAHNRANANTAEVHRVKLRP
jgi:hypothetical protein